MSILSTEELAGQLTEFVGADTSDKAMNFVANCLDTLKALSENQGIPEEEVTRRVEQNNEEWRRRFMNRFYSGISGNPGDMRMKHEDGEPIVTASSITVEDLFS